MKSPDYSIITELPNTEVPKEQLERFYQRYKFAAQHTQGGKVLEIACGGGQGLSLLSSHSSFVVGMEYDLQNAGIAGHTYTDSKDVQVLQMDAHELAFRGHTFDLVAIFEAIYYFNDIQGVLKECRRVMKPEAKIVIGSANREWSDFNPSPFSVRYYSLQELYELLDGEGFEVEVYISHRIPENRGVASKALSLAKRFAVRWGLMPKSMRAKRILKKLISHQMVTLPCELEEGLVEYIAPERANPKDYGPEFKVMYAVANLKNGKSDG